MTPGLTLNCPRCGGTFGVLEDAAALVCPYCSVSFYLAGTGDAGWMVDPLVPAERARTEARRWLRDEQRRVTRLGAPRGLFVPFYWIRGRRCRWDLVDAPGPVPADGEPLGEARLSLEAYRRALPAHSVSRLVRGGTTRLESLTGRLLDPERLPEGYEIASPECTREEAARRSGGRRVRAESRGVAATLEEHVSLVGFPVLLVPFTPRDEGEADVVVDAVTGRVLGAAPAVPIEAPVARSGIPPRLVLLECGDCGWELEPRERDRLHPCPHCQATWEITDGERRRVPQWVLEGEPGPGGRWLPFWVFGPDSGGTTPPEFPFLVPAYTARHPEEQVHLAARLTAQPPRGEWGPPGPWPQAGASVGSREARGWRWAVEGALSRSSLADFARFLKAGAVIHSEAPRGLVWIPFTRRGGDLVEPRTGARVRAQGTSPWTSRRAA